MVTLEEFMNLFELRKDGHSISSISRLSGLDRKTVRKYLSRGRNHPPQPTPRQSGPSKLEPFETMILALLGGDDFEGIPATAIYEQLVEKGYDGSLSLVQKWVGRHKKGRRRNVVVRFETLPGQQAQVDWGEKRIYNEGLKRKVTVYIFAMTLGYSRTRFVHFVPKADMYHFLRCHQLAFEFFGGMPREILYDQNRCVVLKPGYGGVEYNRRFMDFALHYGFRPRVCRPYRPQTKGKVENLVKFVKQNFLSVQRGSSIRELNRRKKAWLDRVNGAVHSTTGEIPLKRLPKEGLTPFDSVAPYDVCYVESRKVFSDGTFSFRGRRFSVPPEYIGRTVTVRYRPERERLSVFFQERPLCEHRTDSEERYVIKRAHRHQIWKLWRDERRLFYRKRPPRPTENHPLSVYEAFAAAGGVQ